MDTGSGSSRWPRARRRRRAPGGAFPTASSHNPPSAACPRLPNNQPLRFPSSHQPPSCGPNLEQPCTSANQGDGDNSIVCMHCRAHTHRNDHGAPKHSGHSLQLQTAPHIRRFVLGASDARYRFILPYDSRAVRRCRTPHTRPLHAGEMCHRGIRKRMLHHGSWCEGSRPSHPSRTSTIHPRPKSRKHNRKDDVPSHIESSSHAFVPTR
jgi:hypothetical protein